MLTTIDTARAVPLRDLSPGDRFALEADETASAQHVKIAEDSPYLDWDGWDDAGDADIFSLHDGRIVRHDAGRTVYVIDVRAF